MSKSAWACTGATRDDCKERRRHSKRILFSPFRSTARMYNIFDHNVYCTKKTFWSQQFLFLHLAAMSKYIYNNIYIYTYFFYGPSERKDAWTCSQAGVLRVYKNSPSDSRPSGYKSLRYRLRECSLCAEGARCSGLLACVSAACVPGSTAKIAQNKSMELFAGFSLRMQHAQRWAASSPPSQPTRLPTHPVALTLCVCKAWLHACGHACAFASKLFI